MSDPKDTAVSNMDVDYVIPYDFAGPDSDASLSQFEKLIESLNKIGVTSEVRNGEDKTVLVFVKLASKEHLYGEVYRSRYFPTCIPDPDARALATDNTLFKSTKDWFNGVRSTQPEQNLDDSTSGQALYPAERLRIVYQLITNPVSEGGAGITPKHGEWKNVGNIFALHDHKFNSQWIKKWSRKYLLDNSDLDEIRDRFGEKVAFYFAFTQAYFSALLGIAAFGASAWLLLGYFSPIFAIVNGVLCIIFVEWWKMQEYDLAVRWGVRNVSSIDSRRHGFKPEQERIDAVTGEKVQFFPAQKRLLRQLLLIPFVLTACVMLGALIATCFGIEIFISEVYKGPGKQFLVFLPTGIITTMQPLILGILSSLAERLTQYENHETDSAHSTALTQKIFVLNFITSYLPVFLTAFVYVPFASAIVPYLDVFSLTVRPFADDKAQLYAPKVGFQINPARLRTQVIYFTVTAQIVNQTLEIVVPFLLRLGKDKYKEMQNKRNGTADIAADDVPEEKAFLKRVRKEARLPEYDVTTDLREMVVQYGYLSLFGVVWPPTAVSFLVNNWFELRTDAAKICNESQRPTPWRADSIGPWLDSLEFLTWLGSLTTAALVYMFQNDSMGPGGSPDSLKGWALLLSVFVSEHAYLAVRWVVRSVVSQLDSPGRQMERAERYRVRTRYLEESLGEQASRIMPSLGEKEEQINRQSLEEAARQGSLGTSTPEEQFWRRQRTWHETVEMGRRLLNQKQAPKESKKAQ